MHQNTGATDREVDAILAKISLPVIVKREEGNRLQYSHYFFICTCAQALKTALNFEGFLASNLVIQEYLEHSEQVYKLYVIGPNYFGSEIRESVPHDEIMASGA